MTAQFCYLWTRLKKRRVFKIDLKKISIAQKRLNRLERISGTFPYRCQDSILATASSITLGNLLSLGEKTFLCLKKEFGRYYSFILLLTCPVLLPAQVQDSLVSFFPRQAEDSTGVTLEQMTSLYEQIVDQLGQNLILEQTCPLKDLQAELTNTDVDINYWLQKSFDLRRFGQIDCALRLLQQLRTFTEAYSLPDRVLIESHLSLTWSEYLGDYQAASQHIKFAMELMPSQTENAAWAYYAAGRVHHRLANFAAAYEETQQALSMARAENNPELEARCLGSLALINRDVFFGETLKAVPFHEGAIRIAETLTDTTVLLNELLYLAANYGEAGEHPRYLELIQKTLDIAGIYKDIRIEEKLLISYGAFLSSKGVLEEAEQLFLLAMDLARRINKRAIISHLHYQLFEVYLLQGQVEPAYQILADGIREGVLDSMALQEQLYAVDRVRGNPAKALQHLEKAYDAVKGQYMDRNAAMLSFWEAQLETKESLLVVEQQEERLNAEKQRRMLYAYLLLAFGLLFIMAAYGFYYQRKSSRKLSIQKRQIEEQAQELRQLDDLKSRFFTNVSHELRTPLSLILGPIRSILNNNALTKEDSHLLSMAANNGEQLNRLVNEILDFSKLESKQVVVQESPINLYLFLEHLISRFEYVQLTNKIDFIFDFQADKEMRVDLDKVKMEKVINNLLSNAFKFTPVGGRISLRVVDKGDQLYYEVADTGRGIASEDLPHVFERYYQTSHGSTVEVGTGIGLALSNQYVQLFGGEMKVDSELGKGSKFQVLLPKKLSQTSASASGDSEVSTGPAIEEGREKGSIVSQRSILVVEDNADLRSYLAYILGKRYQLTTVAHGGEALEYLSTATKRPDLIISDLMMPVVDGFQLLNELRRTPQYSRIPVVMLTAKTNIRDKLKALRIGIDDYLVKPFMEEELVARVDNLLRHASTETTENLTSAEEEEIRTRQNVGAVPKTQYDLDWLAKLEQVVLTQLGDFHLTADMVARKMLMSRTQLFRKIKKLTGLTVNQYIQEMRFQEARKLLEDQSHRSVKSVALTVGFKHVKNFSQRFKDRFGRLPSTYF